MAVNTEKTIETLREENSRLIKALIEIQQHINVVNELFDSISDIIVESSGGDVVQESDIKALLKKYSNLR